MQRFRSFKFNVDRVSRGKLGPAGIGGVLHDEEGEIKLFFSEPVGIKDSNEVEFPGIRKALELQNSFENGKLIIDSDSTNAIAWARGKKTPPWRLISILRGICKLCHGKDIEFKHVRQSANRVAD